MFYIPDNSTARLKSYSSSSKGAKGVIRIEVEFASIDDMGWELRSLVKIEEKQKADALTAKRAAAEAVAKKPKPLALPAPLRALPKPVDRP